MRKIVKNILAILLIVTLILPNSIKVSAKDNKNYIAIGDSITTGYGLEGYQVGEILDSSYVGIVADNIKANDCINLAINSQTSKQLLEGLTTVDALGKRQFKEADVITLSIGSNDLLLPFIDIFMKTIGVEDGNFTQLQEKLSSVVTNDFGKFVLLLKQLDKEFQNNKILNKACEEYPATFTSIISELKKLAPNANIYVINAFNPFYKMQFTLGDMMLFDMGNRSETYIKKINKAYDNNSKDYKIIDTYKLFKNAKDGKQNVVNANMDTVMDIKSINFDPHPNQLGHQMLANEILTKIGVYKYNKPMISKITDKKSNQLTITLKKVSGANIKYQIMIATDNKFSKNKKVITSTKNSVNFTKLAKSKKYYVKSRIVVTNVLDEKVYSSWSNIKIRTIK